MVVQTVALAHLVAVPAIHHAIVHHLHHHAQVVQALVAAAALADVLHLVVGDVQEHLNHLHVQVVQVLVAVDALADVLLAAQEAVQEAVQVDVLAVVVPDVVHHVQANAKGNALGNVRQVATEGIVAVDARVDAQAPAPELVFNTVQEDATIHVTIPVLAHVKPTAVWVLVRV